MSPASAMSRPPCAVRARSRPGRSRIAASRVGHGARRKRDGRFTSFAAIGGLLRVAAHVVAAALRHAQEAHQHVAVLAAQVMSALMVVNCQSARTGSRSDWEAGVLAGAERERLEPDVDLARLQELPARRRAADRGHRVVGRRQPDRLGDVLHDVGGAFLLRQDAEIGAAQIGQRLECGRAMMKCGSCRRCRRSGAAGRLGRRR